METRILNALAQRAPIAADPLLKATSLLYLKDALEGERYEECAELIASAKSFRAGQREISNTLSQAVRKLEAGPSGAGAYRSRMFS